ncbi:hypothetical protein RJJ65_29205 [Rhizobium hidalgonense]|uniref:Uncharacterized protein n=2 Tax=Rhizobium hidalgonense TaxID=1538159 RepID=A0A2A6K8T6_9HYPH|nr:hypothetical protein [Rhizobium hidalgonense]MDR9776660.1 hypothetical protein [Rhizobium hidalgonense]MDR9815055.1 hypothetical protein [Rhizobium hidalgonense]MDR9823196.1 hypothetical protein [Rhizobium hidalgonense]PDT20775.1 hypothetical protein CO674_25315 [Rhizobium hidalgonense]PON07008.1 hypothetical protein ATY29_12985 [Rhizobium hidalgonense]
MTTSEATTLLHKSLKLMAEVQCWAIWDVDTLDNIDPSTLPISQTLAEAVNQWSDWFDSIYKLDQPNFQIDISFSSKEEEDQFYDEGWRLLSRLKNEMPSVEWWYRDRRLDAIRQDRPSG